MFCGFVCVPFPLPTFLLFSLLPHHTLSSHNKQLYSRVQCSVPPITGRSLSLPFPSLSISPVPHPSPLPIPSVNIPSSLLRPSILLITSISSLLSSVVASATHLPHLSFTFSSPLCFSLLLDSFHYTSYSIRPLSSVWDSHSLIPPTRPLDSCKPFLLLFRVFVGLLTVNVEGFLLSR